MVRLDERATLIRDSGYNVQGCGNSAYAQLDSQDAASGSLRLCGVWLHSSGRAHLPGVVLQQQPLANTAPRGVIPWGRGCGPSSDDFEEAASAPVPPGPAERQAAVQDQNTSKQSPADIAAPHFRQDLKRNTAIRFFMDKEGALGMVGRSGLRAPECPSHGKKLTSKAILRCGRF